MGPATENARLCAALVTWCVQLVVTVCSGVARICCEERQSWKVGHRALTANFRAGCSSCSMTNSSVTNAVLIERVVSCWHLHQLILQTTQYLDSWLSDLRRYELKWHCWKSRGHVPECPIAGDATDGVLNVVSDDRRRLRQRRSSLSGTWCFVVPYTDRCTVTSSCRIFLAVRHHRPLTSIKLYCLVTEAQSCDQLAQNYCAAVPGWKLYPRPLSYKSDDLPQQRHHKSSHVESRIRTSDWYWK